MARPVPETAITAMLAREDALFTQRNPVSKQLSGNAAKNWLKGVPMHWMVDWGMPFPLFAAKAQGVDVTDADGHTYIDFCLGDTGAMFGHSPAPIVETLRRRRLQKGIADVIIKHSLPWHVVRAGARVEFMCTPTRPKNGGEAAQVIHRPIDMALHHHFLNRGVIVTPFHNMMLICPATTAAHVDQLVTTLDRCIAELTS